jgi:ribosomal protein S18 acetylase RimI-like enzyme
MFINYKLERYDHLRKMPEPALAQVVSLYRRVFTDEPWNYSAASLPDRFIKKELGFFTSAPSSAVITAELDSKVIGFRIITTMDEVLKRANTEVKEVLETLNIMAKAPSGKISFTSNFGVAAELRRNGVASAMMDLHFTDAIHDGCEYVLGWTSLRNEPMLLSYEKKGYQRISIPNKLPYGIGITFGPKSHQDQPSFILDKHVKDPVYFMKNLMRS